MPNPLTISTDTAAQIAQLRQQISALKVSLSTTYGGGIDELQHAHDTSTLADLQSQLAALTNPADALGPNVTAPASAAPTFATAKIDATTTGVDALKLVTYPGIT